MKPPCECGRPPVARGLCMTCYQRARRARMPKRPRAPARSGPRPHVSDATLERLIDALNRLEPCTASTLARAVGISPRVALLALRWAEGVGLVWCRERRWRVG